LFLMLDAVSAHTDCLIQIVKERRSFWLLREWHSTQPPSRVKPYFQRLFEATDLACLRCRLPCRWRRIIGPRISLARRFLKIIANIDPTAQIPIKPCVFRWFLHQGIISTDLN
ncbi:hypothetical protein, partial [Aeromonas enteropelogenes]|uniref:hypothetical protein n=1 Tax=Aeromonas enteropelogenes TaxID=29489 RepID=UPI003BA185DD